MRHNKTFKYALLASLTLTFAVPQPAEASWLSSLKKKVVATLPKPVQKAVAVKDKITESKFKAVVKAHEEGTKFGIKSTRLAVDHAGDRARVGLAVGAAPVVLGTAGALAGGAIGTAGVVGGTAVATGLGTAGAVAGTAGVVGGTAVATGLGTAGAVAGTAGVVGGTAIASNAHAVETIRGTRALMEAHRDSSGYAGGGALPVRNDLNATGGVEVAHIEVNPGSIPTVNEIAATTRGDDSTPITTGMINDGKLENAGKPLPETIPSTPSTTPVLVGATGVGTAEITAGLPTVVTPTTQAPLVSPERQAKLDAYTAAKEANAARQAAKAEATAAAKADRDAKVAAATAKQAENKVAMAEKTAATQALKDEREAKLAAAKAEKEATNARVVAQQAENKAKLAEKNAATAAAKAEREAKLAALAESVAKQKTERAARLQAGVSVASTGSAGPGSAVVCVYNCDNTAY